MKLFILGAIALGTMTSHPALAVEAHHQPAATSAATSAQLADGEVRRVDKDAGKITIKHGPIQSLDMPPMTMVFQVKDPTMLDRVKVGDRIKFTADRIGGAYTVTKIDPVK